MNLIQEITKVNNDLVNAKRRLDYAEDRIDIDIAIIDIDAAEKKLSLLHTKAKEAKIN